MNSHWFKFYGQDWLTDLKIIMLSPVDRLCFITLLCLASTTDDAVIKNCNENALIELTHLYNNPYDDKDNDYNRAKGCLQRFNDNAMITIDNNGNITINNFLKRQGSNLTGYERVKKHREKSKYKIKKDNNVINDNAMITSDKIREDKIREDKIVIEQNQNTLFFTDKARQEFAVQNLITKNGSKNENIYRQEIEKFINYWTELNKSGTKQRWELEKTFEVDKRLRTWFSNFNKFNSK